MNYKAFTLNCILLTQRNEEEIDSKCKGSSPKLYACNQVRRWHQ